MTEVLSISPTSTLSNTLVEPEIENVLLFQVTALSFGTTTSTNDYNGPPPLTCLLELELPRNELTLRRFPTTDTCTIPDLLLDNNRNNGPQQRCPRHGCYCPRETVQWNKPSVGTTGPQLTKALNNSLEQVCHENNNNRDRRSLEGIAHQERGRGRTNHDKDKNENRRKDNDNRDSCPTKVKEIESIVEVQQREPCHSFVPFHAGFVTVTDVDPCSLPPGTFQEYLNELRKSYNQFQFDNCDPLFRRIIEWQVMDDICEHDNNKNDGGSGGGSRDRRLRRLTGGQSSRASGTRTGEPKTGLKRRHRKLSNKEAMAEEEATHQPRGDHKIRDVNDKMAKMSLDNEQEDEQEDERFSHGIEDISTSIDRSLENDRPKQSKTKRSRDRCLCAGCFKGTGRSITEEEFKELSKRAMRKVTSGRVQVLDFFETDNDYGCPKRKDDKLLEIKVDLQVTFHVVVERFSSTFLAQRERDCIIQYNLLVAQNCAQGYTQFRSCEITTTRHRPNVLLYSIRGTAFDHVPVFSGALRHSTRNRWSSYPSSSSHWIDRSFSRNVDRGYYAVSTQTHRRHGQPPNQVLTDPVDVCVCKNGGGSGINPTLQQYEQALKDRNGGIVSIQFY